MLVSICTTKETVMTTLVSMVANYGCKFTKLRTFNCDDIKCSDICILDLDNLKEFFDEIKKDINILSEITIIGISSSEEILNEFKDYLNTEKKPFNSKTFITYKEKIKEEYNSEFTINKDVDFIYNKLGIKKSDLLNADNLSSEILLETLRHKINKQESILSEDDYFKSLDIGELAIPDTKGRKKEKIIDNNIVKYEDKALEKYRLYKLKSLNLSPFEIEQQLSILKVARDERTANERRNKSEQHRNNLLEKLKNGELVNKNKPTEEPKLKINRNIENQKQLSPEEIYSQNKNKNKEKENIEVKIKIENNTLTDKTDNKPKLPDNKNNSISETETEKEIKTTKINKDLSDEENLLDNYNKQKENKKKEPKQNKKDTNKETPKIQSPISNTSNNDSFKTKRPDLEEENKKEENKKKKDYSSMLEKEKKVEEEQKSKNNISILDINISKEQEEEIKNKIQNLRKYKRNVPNSSNKTNEITKEELPENNVEIKEEIVEEIITENKNEQNDNIKIPEIKDTNNTISESPKEIIETKISKKEDIEDTKKVESIKEVKILEKPEEVEENTTEQNISKPTSTKKQEKPIEEPKSKKEDSDSNPEKESEYQKLYEAIHRLDGSNSNNKTSSTNNNDYNAIKNIKAELPTKSLFDLIKEKNKDIQIIDFKEQRKNAIDKIVKPPKR